MKKDNNISKCIDGLSDSYLGFLECICNIESKSTDKAGVDAVADFIIDYLKDSGYEIERRSFLNAGDCLCIDYVVDADKPFIVLSAHMDTVYEKGTFGSPAVRRDDKYIYGPGVCDCKGGIAVALLVMETLKEAEFSGMNVRLLLQSDEEVSSSMSKKETIRYICDKAKGCVAFLNLEPKYPGKITLQRGGIVHALMTVTGVSAHSSVKERGANAVCEAAEKIVWARGSEKAGDLSLNFGMIHGGSASNVVPDKCTVDIEARVKTMEHYHRAQAFFMELTEKCFVEGTHTEVSIVSERIPMELTDGNVNLFHRLRAISESYGFGNLEMRSSMGGSDASYTTAAGIPTADGLGMVGDHIHTKEEKAEISSLAQSAEFIIKIIEEMSE